MKSTLTSLNWGKKIKITDCCTEKANKYSKCSNGEVSTATGNVASRTKGTLCQDKLSEVPHWLSTSHTFLASWTLQKHSETSGVGMRRDTLEHQGYALFLLLSFVTTIIHTNILHCLCWSREHTKFWLTTNLLQTTGKPFTDQPALGGCHYHKARAKWALAWCKWLHR